MERAKTVYCTPQAEVVELLAECVICASGDYLDITVPDPWAGNTEVDW